MVQPSGDPPGIPIIPAADSQPVPPAQVSGRFRLVLAGDSIRGALHYLFKRAVRVERSDGGSGFIVKRDLAEYLATAEGYEKPQAEAIAKLAINALRQSARPVKSADFAQRLIDIKLAHTKIEAGPIQMDLLKRGRHASQTVKLEGINDLIDKQTFDELTASPQPITVGSETFFAPENVKTDKGKKQQFIQMYETLTGQTSDKRDSLIAERRTRLALASVTAAYDFPHDLALKNAYQKAGYTVDKVNCGARCWFEMRNGNIYAYKTVSYSIRKPAPEQTVDTVGYTRCTIIKRTGEIAIQPTQWRKPIETIENGLKNTTIANQEFGKIKERIEDDRRPKREIERIDFDEDTYKDYGIRGPNHPIRIDDSDEFYKPEVMKDQAAAQTQLAAMFNKMKEKAVAALANPNQPVDQTHRTIQNNLNSLKAERAVHAALASMGQTYDADYSISLTILCSEGGYQLSELKGETRCWFELRDGKIYAKKAAVYLVQDKNNPSGPAVRATGYTRCTIIDIETGETAIGPTEWGLPSICQESVKVRMVEQQLQSETDDTLQQRMGDIRTEIHNKSSSAKKVGEIEIPIYTQIYRDFVKGTPTQPIEVNNKIVYDPETDTPLNNTKKLFLTLKDHAETQLPVDTPNKSKLAEAAAHIALASISQTFEVGHLGQLFKTSGLILQQIPKRHFWFEVHNGEIYAYAAIPYSAVKQDLDTLDVEMVAESGYTRCTIIDIATGENRVGPTVWGKPTNVQY